MKHKYRRTYISILAILLCFTTLSYALAADTIENQFQAFKNKIYKSNKNITNSNNQYLQPRNPLSFANQKPIDKKYPATHYATAGDRGNLSLSSPLSSRTSESLRRSPLVARPSEEELKAKKEANLAKQRVKIEKEDFNAALKAILPLKPAQIRDLLENFKENRKAAETPIVFPRPKIQVETVSLDPSRNPPVVKTSPGYVTTVMFLDKTGAPWAIQDIGWAGKFQITGSENGGNIIRIVPQTAHGAGNISVRLVDLTTPVTLSLRTGLKEVYYRFDARIPKAGPLATAPLIENGGLDASVGNDENLVPFLEGTPPEQSEKLTVTGVDSRTKVWKKNGSIYLRSPFTLLSPSWKSSVTSADGINVYTLNKASVILLSDNGRMVKAHIISEESSR